jgi:hypothetical protein
VTGLAQYRALAAAARAETLEGLTAQAQLADVVEALCDAVEKLTPPTTSDDQRKRLLAEIRESGGEWTGARVARVWSQRFGYQITPERGVQHLQRLQEAGHLVLANPPRGRTFILNGGRQDPPRVEWATQVPTADGSFDVGAPHSEEFARNRMRLGHPQNVALLRRTVTYSPWVEVPANAEAGDG